uniref:Uncharacterized protein n=1 Tax=Timema bartmani TaxID=61472 RepID=A0A7R9I6A1_9NEOP|nr:unnamed protein product [Timema bartmani]
MELEQKIAREALHMFKDHKDLEVKLYSTLHHSPLARTLLCRIAIDTVRATFLVKAGRIWPGFYYLDLTEHQSNSI